ncbi:hypothetical protein DPV78_005139 [Talaromyces pinophilus]|nr:hypothetical protein DPV78_005139 [Talaromyces pinophilus]
MKQNQEGEWVDGEEKEEEEEVGERAAWRLKKEAAGLVMDMGHAGLFARHFKVTSRVLIGSRPCDHERLTHPLEPIRKRQRASLDGFEIGRTLEEAKLRIIHGTERKFQVAFTGMTRCYLMVLLQDNWAKAGQYVTRVIEGTIVTHEILDIVIVAVI